MHRADSERTGVAHVCVRLRYDVQISSHDILHVMGNIVANAFAKYVYHVRSAFLSPSHEAQMSTYFLHCNLEQCIQYSIEPLHANCECKLQP